MFSTLRRGVLLAAAAGVTLLGLGLGQASAALPTLPVALPTTALPALPVAVPALPALPALPVAVPALPATSLPLDPKAPTAGLPVPPVDGGKTPVTSPSVSDVDVAGIGSGNGPELPHLNAKPNLTGSTLDGVNVPDAATLPTADKITDGSALSSLDVTHLVPELGALQMLPQLG
jgi:hypothetical protein